MKEIKSFGSEEPKEQERKKILSGILILLALSVACTVFSILCIFGTRITFIYNRRILFSILSAFAISLLNGVAVNFLWKEKTAIYKTLVSVFIFLLFCFILLFILQGTGFFEIVKDETSLQNFLESKGAFMPVLYTILQYLQVVVLPIPSIVSTLAGVALFGPFKTTIYSLIGILLGSITAFFIGKKLGYKAVVWALGEETLLKWQKKLKGKDNLILTLMFLLPLFPDDILCFIAGLSSMSVRYFLLMITITRFLAITATCYSIGFIPFNTWWGLLIWVLIILSVLSVFLLVYKNLDKLQGCFFKRLRWGNKKK